MKLSLVFPTYYRVKRGQTIASIARTYHLPPRVLAVHNGLTAEVEEGQVIEIPQAEGNLYTVRGGETKTLLCGSPERFAEKNQTTCFYIGQVVLL